MIARFKRWLRDRRTPSPWILTERELQLLQGGFLYRSRRPWIYGVVGRRET